MNMSDMDDLNVLSFQNQGTTISAMGPNLNNTNISSLSFRNNIMTSTMNMPCNFDRPRYAESSHYPRSMNYRRDRDTSPMSINSASSLQPRHMRQASSISSHRSFMNAKSGSPMSVRTMDSNTSVSANDIASAFRNRQFNKIELKIIEDAYKKYRKSRTRRRVEKRRNMKMFLKGFRRRSGDDSGDQASDSSISSDDCRSIRTSRSTIYKGNMSSCRSTKTDLSDFRRTIRESNMITDCTENFKQNSFKSMFSGATTRDVEHWHDKEQQNSLDVSNIHKDRFKNTFLLPAQRFNHSVALLPIPEKSTNMQILNKGNKLDSRQGSKYQGNDSEQEEIFADVTVMENSSINNNSKRSLEEQDVPVRETKRYKSKETPQKKITESPEQNVANVFSKQKSSDFVFAKPQLPIKKSTIAKQQKTTPKSSQTKPATQRKKPKQSSTDDITSITLKSVEQPIETIISCSQKAIEKLISKSALPKQTVGANSEKTSPETLSQIQSQEKEEYLDTEMMHHSNTDLSMRPSFIKRKLFSQKVHVAEKNSSSESLQADSPQKNVYSKIQKEKNKARKLVTNQSCLNRDLGDDSNLLDLIHKVVPADQMNVTTAVNRTETQNNNSKPTISDNWDITSIITTCNNIDDVSDTYTDEEIFSGKPSDQQKNKTKLNNETNEQQKDIQNTEQAKENKKPKNENKMQSANNRQNNSKNEKQKTTQSKVVRQRNIEVVPKSTTCKVVIDKLLPHNLKELSAIVNESSSPSERNELSSSNVYKGVKTFWDTDTESDLEATFYKRANPKSIVTPTPDIAAVIPQVKNPTNAKWQLRDVKKEAIPKITTINKNDNGSMFNKKCKPSTTNQKKNSSIINKENKPCKQPENTTNSIKIDDKLIVENKLENEVVKNKSNGKVLKNKMVTNSQMPASKQNIQTEETNKGAKNKIILLDARFEPKIKTLLPQKNNIKVTPDKLKINNSDSILNNNESHNTKKQNNAVKIRAQRKPKINRCSNELDTCHQTVTQSVTDNNTTLYRSLRTRQVDLSTSLTKSNNCNTTVAKKTETKNKRSSRHKNVRNLREDKTIQSDESFTLAVEVPPSDKTMRNRNISANFNERKTRQSNVSFTLISGNQALNDTVITRSSKRNREIESLQNSFAIFYKSELPTSKKIAAESRAINKSNNIRSNRSRRLL